MELFTEPRQDSVTAGQAEWDLKTGQSRSERTERLQILVAHLLLRNQSIRFELYEAQDRLMQVEHLVSELRSNEWQAIIPLDALYDLRKLCSLSGPEGESDRISPFD